jgi:hypothetical protein
MRIFLPFIFVFGAFECAYAQYATLTNVITFDQMQRRSVERQVEWKNPDGSAERMVFTEMAIPIDQKMRARTKKFLIRNYGWDSVWLDPRIIVFHSMGDGDLQHSLEISSFLNDEIPEDWGNLSKAGKLPNGAHFIIDRNGHIICLAPPFRRRDSTFSYDREDHHWIVKRHQDGNPLAIGIENETEKDDWTNLTDAQIESNAKLARWLLWMENGRIEYLTSHHQFDSEKFTDAILGHFGLRHLEMKYRTRGRQDFGDANLDRILMNVTERGWRVMEFSGR